MNFLMEKIHVFRFFFILQLKCTELYFFIYLSQVKRLNHDLQPKNLIWEKKQKGLCELISKTAGMRLIQEL